MKQRVETSDRTVGNFVLFWMPHHYSYHLSCISHEINTFQKCFVQGRDILHFTDSRILCGLNVMALKNITCEGDIFVVIASSSFIWKHLLRIWNVNTQYNRQIKWEVWGVPWKERKSCQKWGLNFLLVLFPQIRVTQKGLADGRNWGKGEERWLSSGGGLLYKILELLPQPGPVFTPKETRHSPH